MLTTKGSRPQESSLGQFWIPNFNKRGKETFNEKSSFVRNWTFANEPTINHCESDK
jgi:hypothetical protein